MGRNSYFVDDGWAFWIDGDDTSTVYINDWLNPKRHNYIDIAISTRGIKDSKSLNIYIPFEVSRDELDDISLRLNKDDILYAIFDAACVIDYQKNVCTSELAYHGKTVDLVHVSKLNYTMKPLATGTMFYLDFAELLPMLDNDEAYFVFRVPHKSVDRVFRPKRDMRGSLRRLRDLITSPVIDQKYGYSVRINEARLLPPEINHVGAFHRQKLRRAVITIALSDGYEVNDNGCYRIRRLEEELYHGYEPEGFSNEDVINYQWEQTRERSFLGHFNFYFSIAHNTVNHASMVIYLILIVIIGSMGSALWDLIKTLLG